MAALPSKIGSFEVVRQIGAGGMGTVYLGRDPELNRQVAIKVIREAVKDQEVLERFFREARAAAALRHPNIITIYASGQHELQPYIAMEFVEGESLADVIRERSRLTLEQKHEELERQLAILDRHLSLTPDEQLEQRRLKKEKLRVKEQLYRLAAPLPRGS